MFAPWRLNLRKAEHALRAGRLEEAAKVVGSPEIRSYRQARDLADRVVEALAHRAEAELERGDTERAWLDIAEAERLNGGVAQLAQTRQKLVNHTIDDVRSSLQDGQPAAAQHVLNQLRRHGVESVDARQLHDVANRWLAGSHLARAGRFAQAVQEYRMAASALPDCVALERCLHETETAAQQMAGLESRLHRAVQDADWDSVLHQADAILKLAPEHVAARAARRRAWLVAGIPVSNVPHRAAVLVPAAAPIASIGATNGQATSGAASESEDGAPRSRRFLLWIDAVGGYLICLGDRISIGQPAGWHVDVPVMADLSRLHAWIERDREGYCLRAARPATVDGRPVQDKALLRNDSLIVLGAGTRLRFRRPSALSNSARLEIESKHRLALAADSVVLMADTLIIGPDPSSHIVAEHLGRQIVISRQDESLWCRVGGSFEVDGLPASERSPVTLKSSIRGEGFALALEPVES